MFPDSAFPPSRYLLQCVHQFWTTLCFQYLSSEEESWNLNAGEPMEGMWNNWVQGASSELAFLSVCFLFYLFLHLHFHFSFVFFFHKSDPLKCLMYHFLMFVIHHEYGTCPNIASLCTIIFSSLFQPQLVYFGWNNFLFAKNSESIWYSEVWGTTLPVKVNIAPANLLSS